MHTSPFLRTVLVVLGICLSAIFIAAGTAIAQEEEPAEGSQKNSAVAESEQEEPAEQDSDAGKKDEKDEKASPDDAQDDKDDEADDKAEADDKDDDKQDGQEDLDKAFQLKITASSTRDLDEVADLCESAIEKGLKKESEEQAKELWAVVLLSHAKQLDRRIMTNGRLNTRWRWLRSQAISRLDKVVEIRPTRISALILLARLHSMESGDRGVALEAIEKAIAQIKDDNQKLSQALFIRASLAEDETTRIADLTQAVKIDPQNADALMARASYFLAKEDSEEAMTDFKKLLAIEKDSTDRHQLIAQVLRDNHGMFKESAEVLTWAIEIDGENDELFVRRGQAFFSAEDDDKALADFNKALDINRQNTTALSFRSRVYMFQEKYEEALNDANELIQQKPDSPEGLSLRSLIHRSQTMLSEAIEDTRGLLEKDPDNLDYKFDLAILLNANEQPSKAIPIFDQIIDIIQIDAPKTQILRNRGDAYLSLGEHQKAIDDYELALELIEENSGSKLDGMSDERETDMKAGLLNNLAWVLSTSTKEEVRDGNRAVELATEASELTDYKQAFILSTLASGYAENGDFETARKWAAKAVELSESDEQREGIQDELERYKENKAWREIENVEAEKKEEDQKSEKDKDDSKSESDKDDSKEDEQDKDSSESKEDDER